jgi:hypothetical protein
MAGAICQNRTLALEAKGTCTSIQLHVTRVEKEVYKCTRFLIAPREGLDVRLQVIEEAQNGKIATFQAEMLRK